MILSSSLLHWIHSWSFSLQCNTLKFPVSRPLAGISHTVFSFYILFPLLRFSLSFTSFATLSLSLLSLPVSLPSFSSLHCNTLECLLFSLSSLSSPPQTLITSFFFHSYTFLCITFLFIVPSLLFTVMLLSAYYFLSLFSIFSPLLTFLVSLCYFSFPFHLSFFFSSL